MSIIKATDLVEVPATLEIGSICHVKVKKKVFKGRVVTFGKLITSFCFQYCILVTRPVEEVRNVEDQFLNEVYTPEFLQEDNNTLEKNDTVNDDIEPAADSAEINSSVANKSMKRKRNESNKGK